MNVGLFVPCYVDQLYPEVAFATVALLKKFDVRFTFPREQTCCGQPMANTGLTKATEPLAHKFVENFESFDYVVCPSGSCTSMVRHHYDEYFPDSDAFTTLKTKTLELSEFLVDVLNVDFSDVSFPHKVGLHQSCHGLRELRLGTPSEVNEPPASKVRGLLETVRDIELVDLKRPDECCGFGGTFSVNEEAVSCMMGLDRIADHRGAGAEVMTAVDMSCLMHLGGLSARQSPPLPTVHVAEILAGTAEESMKARTR